MVYKRSVENNENYCKCQLYLQKRLSPDFVLIFRVSPGVVVMVRVSPGVVPGDRYALSILPERRTNLPKYAGYLTGM